MTRPDRRARPAPAAGRRYGLARDQAARDQASRDQAAGSQDLLDRQSVQDAAHTAIFIEQQIGQGPVPYREHRHKLLVRDHHSIIMSICPL
jgi:hypothetical protein